MRLMMICALLLTARMALAEPGPIGQWLMNEPYTLWDIGMHRAGAVAKSAAGGADRSTGRNFLGWAAYDWDNNEINITMSIFGYKAEVSHKQCNSIRRAFLGRLGGWGLLSSPPKEKWAKETLLDTVGRWFSHNGFRSGSRDEKLAEKLARIMFVEIKLNGANTRISCRERLLKFDAPSMPITSATKQ